jgi:sarcosine oxidase
MTASIGIPVTKNYDVIVAGLGAMGGAAACHLARRGVRVLGLDRFRPPHAHGSSHGRTRVIREAYFEDPVYVPLVRRAGVLWRELEAEVGRPLLRVTGALMLGADGCAAVRGSQRSAQAHGIPHERLAADEVRARFPMLRPAPDTVALYEPGAGALAVESCVAAHLQVARAAGAALRFDEPMLGWRAGADGVEVTTAVGTYRAGALVVAVGAWLPQLVPSLPLRVERQVQLWFRPVAEPAAFRPDRFPVFLWELPSGALFYGLPDLGDGVKAARHHGGRVASVEDVGRDATEEDVGEVRHFLERQIPGANGEVAEASVCLYTNTPTGHFLLDRHPEQARVWLVSPCSGHGFKFAPAIGEQVAEWLISGRPRPELEPFRLAAVQALPHSAG